MANARARIVEVEPFLEGNEISRSRQIFLLEVFLGNNRTCQYWTKFWIFLKILQKNVFFSCKGCGYWHMCHMLIKLCGFIYYNVIYAIA